MFRSEAHCVELKFAIATFRSRKIKLPAQLQKLQDQNLRSRIVSTPRMPIALETALDISIGSGDIRSEIAPQRVEAFFDPLPGREPRDRLVRFMPLAPCRSTRCVPRNDENRFR